MEYQTRLVAAGGTESAKGRLNEDAFLVVNESQLYIVADGVGSRPFAADASRLAVEETARRYRELIENGVTSASAANSLFRAVQAANDLLIAAGQSDPGHLGMASVMSALAVCESDVCVAHIGDTRVYLARRNEPLAFLTTDHTSAYFLAKSRDARDLRNHPLRRHLLRALGLTHHVEVDMSVLHLEPGDHFLLCSDGLTDVVDEADITESRII